MKKVAIENNVLLFLDELITTLVKKEYFGFLESIEDYVIKLYNTIQNDLPTLTHHTTPNELLHYGKHYVKIKGNKRTTWYVFFEQMKNRFLVQFITNNHTPQSAYLNEL